MRRLLAALLLLPLSARADEVAIKKTHADTLLGEVPA